MKYSHLVMPWVIAIFLLSGCNYLRTFPLYSEIHIEHPESIQLFNDHFANLMEEKIKEGRLDIDNVKIYLKLKTRVYAYLSQQQDIDTGIVTALKNFKVIRGMDRSQVSLIIGAPIKKIKSNVNTEIWSYFGNRRKLGEWDWYYKWGKLRFEDGILRDIDVQSIDIWK